MAEEAIAEDVKTEAVTEAPAEVVEAAKPDTAADTPVKSETLLDGAESEPEKPSKAEWPEDWRERLAGDDQALLKHLKRYSSPANYAKAGYEAQQRIRSGEAKKPLPADAKPEDVSAWRRENGLPETVDDMLKAVEPPKGMVFGEADQPFLQSFAKVAHDRNWTPAQMNDAVGWYAAEQERILAARVEQDKAFREQAQDQLRDEWGAGYRSEINGVKNFLDSNAPAEVRDAILAGRGPDGNLLGNNPHVMRWLASMAREINPAASVMPAGTANAGKSMNDEIAAIEKSMATDINAYYRDTAMQDRYRELIEARNRQNSRAA